MIHDIIQLISNDLTWLQLRHVLVFVFIVGYAFIVSLFGITRLKSPLQVSFLKILIILGKSILVAVIEELLFRIFLFYVVFQRWLHLDFGHALIFTSLIFALGHFYFIGVHVQALHKLELFVGLFIFSMITCKNFPVGNVVFHMFAILGVEVTNLLFDKESAKHWWVWDESHALIRSPIVWAVLLVYYFLI
jgi:hypothetical protein